jgi:hypothetical protein
LTSWLASAADAGLGADRAAALFTSVLRDFYRAACGTGQSPGVGRAKLRRPDIRSVWRPTGAKLMIVDPVLMSKFRRDGWVVIPHAVDETAIAEVCRLLGGVYPAYDRLERSPEKYPWATDGQFGGLRLWTTPRLPESQPCRAG